MHKVFLKPKKAWGEIINNNIIRVIITIAVVYMVCGCYHADREKGAIMPARNRIINAFDLITLALMSNSNNVRNLDFNVFICKAADNDPVMNELLIKLPDGKANLPLLLNTNIDAWLSPERHGSEIAIVSPQHVKIDDKYVCLGIRFDRDIIYFTYVNPP
jgi:hypothetical protein